MHGRKTNYGHGFKELPLDHGSSHSPPIDHAPQPCVLTSHNSCSSTSVSIDSWRSPNNVLLKSYRRILRVPHGPGLLLFSKEPKQDCVCKRSCIVLIGGCKAKSDEFDDGLCILSLHS